MATTDEAFNRGRADCDEGAQLNDCPYISIKLSKAWRQGFRSRQDERIRANLKAALA